MQHTAVDEGYSDGARIRRLEVIVMGNGEPGLKGQMALTEQTVKRIDNSLRWIVRLLTASFLSGLGAIIVALLMGRK